MLIVTEPTLSGLHDLRRIAELARQLRVPAAVCVNKADLKPARAARLEVAAVSLGLRPLGRVRYDGAVTVAQVVGSCVVEVGDGPAATDIRRLWRRVTEFLHWPAADGGDDHHHHGGVSVSTIIAVPVAGSVLASHFGHCEFFALFDVDDENAAILERRDLTPPHHEPGVYPRWLAEHQVTVVLAGNMGDRALHLFAEQGITVMVGIGETDPKTAVQAYLDGRLTTGVNHCDH